MRLSVKQWSLSLVTAGCALGAMPVPAMAATHTYTVRGNDTFWSISQRQHIPLSKLLAANPDKNPLNLYPGLKIRLPEATAAKGLRSRRAYTIQPGDTFWKISRRLGASLQSILALNPKVNPYHLQIGSQVWVPATPSAPISTQAAEVQVQPERHAARAFPGLQADTATRTASAAQTSAAAHSGTPVSYKKEITCTATAYTAAPEENGWGPVDYYGHPLKLGTIAVDPSVIPLGSTVYITGYSFDSLPAGGMIAHATDVGSSIRGNRIDIYVPTSSAHASDFGLQQVKVYILN
ncbi:LysM peptidoglycan-binding domain-containing protein [Alicyclobacillus kakegawensis]|uniref:LysM peptidoglycan-binding domain-containing protein n=1 Tax=Alicyclobacillus kakegawensis TaxID=392012 RepID=UPI0008317930|nr:LysM peptidoglycan-binding domain-containing protein [Alicyclobacillus kakegawensis]